MELGNLPEDVMMEILLWLPVESLLRFQIVQKSWHRLITHPNFIAKHLVNSLLSPNFNSSDSSTILVNRTVLDESIIMDSFLSIFSYPITDDQPFVHFDFKNFLCSDCCDFLEIHGHSHGLVCFSAECTHTFLFNPATREFRQLPQSILLTEPPEDPDDLTSEATAVGFGYDPKSKDFKVVRVVNYREDSSVPHPTRVEVYDLSKDVWREIQASVPACVFWAPSFEMFYKGMYYWWAKHDSQEMVLCFDMTKEIFHAIPVPESFKQLYQCERAMGVLNGSIVFFLYPLVTSNTRQFEMWEMGNDESGGVTMSLDSIIERPLLIVRSDQLLMEAQTGHRRTSQVVSYNLNTKKFTQLPVDGFEGRLQAIILIKSLLSVKGGNPLHLGAASEMW